MRRRGQQQGRGHATGDDDGPDVPLHHKRPFGAGLKRKRVEFVRATEAEATALPGPSTAAAGRGLAIGDLYASIVLAGRSGPASAAAAEAQAAREAQAEEEAGRGGEGEEGDEWEDEEEEEDDAEAPVCAVCALAVTTSRSEHEASVAHQVSLTHSHPPSGLDRTRMGLRTLQSHGWDPDARRGLGLDGQGARLPIRAAGKEDRLGIGAAAEEEGAAAKGGGGAEQTAPRPRPPRAKERRALAARERQRAARLQAEIYGRVDVERYLRGDGADNAMP